VEKPLPYSYLTHNQGHNLESTKIEIRCLSCNATYKLAAEKIPDRGCHATCKKCGHRMHITKPVSARKPAPPSEKTTPPNPVRIAPQPAASDRKPPAKKAQTATPPKKKRFLRIATYGVLVLLFLAGAALFVIQKYDLQITRRNSDPTSPALTKPIVVTKNTSQDAPQPPGESPQKKIASKPADIAETYHSIGDLFNHVNKATATVITYDSGRNVFRQGSGFFINEEGHFITCYHVLKGAYSVYIKIEDKEEYEVDHVIAQDADRDLIKLAVSIPQGTLSPGMWLDIDSKRPKIADKVLVISTPMGLSRTVSDGIISAIRELPTKGLVFQMTVPISPGSSGSPVIDMKGKVVGISFLQLVSGQNLNFAVPSEYILGLKDEPSLTISSWSEKVSRDQNDALKKIQEEIMLQVDPDKKIGSARKRGKFQSPDEKQKLKLAHQIVEESGIARQSRSLSESTLESFETKYKENLETKTQESDEDEKRFKKFKEVIKLSTDPDKLNKYIENQLAAKLSIDELKEVLKWYKSPLGKKISSIEYSSISEKKEQFEKLRLAFRMTRYQTTERLNLFKRLDAATSATDAMIELQTNLIIQNQILELVLSDSKKPDQASIDEIVEEFKKNVDPYLDSLAANLVFAGFVYTYRGVDKNDIEKYVLFSEASAAKHFYHIMNEQSNAYLLDRHKRILTSIIRILENDSWNNIKKDLDKPIAG
jgi:S1-C subfamily serine protease